MKFIRNILNKQRWPDAIVLPGANVEGDKKNLTMGKGTIIENGAVLSTIYGGKITIGRDCTIHRGAMLLTYGGDIILGDNCTVNPYTILYGHGGLSIGNGVRFAAQSVVIPANHTYDAVDVPIYKQPMEEKGIIINDDVWVGAGCTILDGVTIGKGAVIGAGSVVTKDVPPFSVNVGVPSRHIKFRTKTDQRS